MRKAILLSLGVAAVGLLVLASVAMAAKINGTRFDDRLVGTPFADHISGATGGDEIRGRGSRDFLHGDSGDDGVFGQGGPDKIYGGNGDDFLSGGRNNDYINAADKIDGNDAVTCGPGGSDQAVVDPGDAVHGSCEDVRTPQP